MNDIKDWQRYYGEERVKRAELEVATDELVEAAEMVLACVDQPRSRDNSEHKRCIYERKEMKVLTAIFASLFIASAACAGDQHGGQHGKPGIDDRKTTQTTAVFQSSRSESSAQSRASAKSRASANSAATGGNGTGGNAEATGGSANATGGQVVVTTGSWSGAGLTGRMVPDVSAGAPVTSTSCRNGISAGGSGNGWGGLLGFFAEDDLCEWRLLEASYRNSGDLDKANAIRSGMTLQRCEKLAPKEREMFGDLCPKPPVQESQNAAFSSAG